MEESRTWRKHTFRAAILANGIAGVIYIAMISRSLTAAQRAHPARSLALDGSALASRRPARPPAYAGAARTRPGDHGDHARREGAAGGHRALRAAPRGRGGGGGSRRPFGPAGGGT